MKIIKYPTEAERAEILRRPAIDTHSLYETVSRIIERVRSKGDVALRRYAHEFDGVEFEDFAVSELELDDTERSVSKELKDAIAIAKANIEKFHAAEKPEPYRVETTPGVTCWKKWLPIERVGIYIPAGSAPLFSTVLMLAIPARLAGCREIVMCSPPQPDGKVNAATLYAAKVCGISKVFKIGGAQAIAALGCGTETVPQVYKIFGPGNQYVTEAKLQVMRMGVAIDMPAGPSEVAVFADETAVPSFVAADLLSQAEHGADSQVILVSTSIDLITESLSEIERQVSKLPRKEIAQKALANSTAVLVASVQDGLDLLNEYAPEHLIIACEKTEQLAEKITNAGSVFLGNFSCESAGDYASGTNHTLPTNGSARAFSGVSVLSFMKSITYQSLTKDGIAKLGPTIEALATAEGLDAHRAAVSIRREWIGA